MHTMKWGELRGQVVQGVLGILHLWQELGPIIRVVGEERAEDPADPLVRSLNLAVGL